MRWRLPIFALVFVLVLTGCGADSTETITDYESVIVGTWDVSSRYSGPGTQYQYFEDGTGVWEGDDGYINLFEYRFINEGTVVIDSDDVTVRLRVYIIDDNTVFQENTANASLEKLTRVQHD